MASERSSTGRLVVLDPLCGHCVALSKVLARREAGVRQDGIHVYWLRGKTDPLAFAAGERCPFPHCFEYVCQPEWIKDYVVAIGVDSHTAAHARLVPSSKFTSSVV
jgi:hypothetical protein